MNTNIRFVAIGLGLTVTCAQASGGTARKMIIGKANSIDAKILVRISTRFSPVRGIAGTALPVEILLQKSNSEWEPSKVWWYVKSQAC